jgi:hypothetical protein
MLTREQIEEIQAESREKGVTIKRLLQEKCIPEHQYFWWKRKYGKCEVPEGFLPVAGGVLPAGIAVPLSGTTSSRGRSKSDPAGENWMSIELRTVAGTDMRIQGGLTPAMVYTILKSL